MVKVHFLGKKGACFYRHYYPVRVFNRQLKESGVEVQFFSSPTSNGIENCDILIVLEQGYRDILSIKNCDRQSAVDFLSSFLPKFKKVIWFDDHDSSGMLRTYIFPLVDIYGKAQILRNRNYYKEQHLTGVVHRDCVTEKFQIDDKSIFKGILSDQEIGKIVVAWNLGLVNWPFFYSWSKIQSQIHLRLSKNYNLTFTKPNLSTRLNHITFRGQMWKNAPTVFWWRNKTTEKLQGFSSKNPGLRIISSGKVSKKEYHLEMRNTVVTVSPFGIGEICYRDFESFINGSLLFKPNMDHLQTWPDLYIDGVTYISHKWDFSDFEEKLDQILSHPERYEEIAREGQRRFQAALTDGRPFVEHFINLINGVEK